jgi:hypothetical protein
MNIASALLEMDGTLGLEIVVFSHMIQLQRRAGMTHTLASKQLCTLTK